MEKYKINKNLAKYKKQLGLKKLKSSDARFTLIMIRNLSINNLMLIDKIDMDFGIGLCVLTGETGAGKSMILESLELLSGRRVKTNIRSDNGQKTVITALVEISKYTLIRKVLDELDINVEDK